MSTRHTLVGVVTVILLAAGTTWASDIGQEIADPLHRVGVIGLADCVDQPVVAQAEQAGHADGGVRPRVHALLVD